MWYVCGMQPCYLAYHPTGEQAASRTGKGPEERW